MSTTTEYIPKELKLKNGNYIFQKHLELSGNGEEGKRWAKEYRKTYPSPYFVIRSINGTVSLYKLEGEFPYIFYNKK